MDRIIPIITDPYYSNSSWFRAMYQEIVNTALAQKDHIVLYDSGLSSADIDRLPPVVLLASGVKEYIQQTISILKAHHKSVILAGLMDDAVDTEVSSVSPATQYEVQLVLNYLHACGRHKIALVGFREHGMNDLIRYREMIEYAEKAAYPITRENIFFRGNSIDKAIHRFYNDIEHYDAAVCPNGAASIYLINYCTRNGIVVPEDLFVISFSDMHMASYSNPSLTCVGSDFASIGKKVVFLWNFLNEHSEDQLIMNIKVVSNLVIRESKDKNREHEDSVGCAWTHRDNGFFIEIPYRTMKTQGFKNMLTAGRTISAIGMACEVSRLIAPCAETGEAAGIAASMAIEQEIDVNDVDYRQLQKEIIQAGGNVHFKE